MAKSTSKLEFDFQNAAEVLTAAKKLKTKLSSELGLDVEIELPPELLESLKQAEESAQKNAAQKSKSASVKKAKKKKDSAKEAILSEISTEKLESLHLASAAHTEVEQALLGSDKIYVPPKLSSEQLESDDLLTPLVPDLWDRAAAVGKQGYPLMIGGEDLEDATAVIYTYFSPDRKARHIVVECQLRQQAEEKLMTAVQVSKGMKTVKKTVKEPYTGRAQWDIKMKIGEKLESWARSINWRVREAKKGYFHPHKTEYLQGLPELEKYLQTLIETQGPQMDPAELELARLYLHDVTDLLQTLEWNKNHPDPKDWRQTFNHKLSPDDPGFIRKNFGPRTATFMITKEIEVKVPVTEGTMKLEVMERQAQRLHVKTDESGTPIWDGSWSKIHSHDGECRELFIRFADGWFACYRPYDSKYNVPTALRGNLQLIVQNAPQDLPPESLVEHLRMLYLNGAPLTKAQVELAYLEDNLRAQGVIVGGKNFDNLMKYKTIQIHMKVRAQEVMLRLANSGNYPPTDDGIAQIMLDGERAIAPEKVAYLRLLFEQHLGLKPGSLAALPEYNPTPVYDVGFYFFRRFDIRREDIKKYFGSLVVGHILTGSGRLNLPFIIESGGLMAQAKRRQMGINHMAGDTLSQEKDEATGGANYLFCRIGYPGNFDIEWSGEALYNLLSRTDWFWRNGDYYGDANKDEDGNFITPVITDIKQMINFASNNEIVFKYGIGLTGPFAPSCIRASKWGMRKEVIKTYQKLGITHLHGIPIEKVVV